MKCSEESKLKKGTNLNDTEPYFVVCSVLFLFSTTLDIYLFFKILFIFISVVIFRLPAISSRMDW